MKGIIILNGEPYKELKEDKDALVYCCDGAYSWCKGKIHIDENIGDFDSLCEVPFPPPVEIYPQEKDFTDFEIAIKRMISFGINEIEIYGGGGKREDHFLSNLHLMYSAELDGVKCKMITDYSVMFFVKGKCELNGIKGLTVSLIPMFSDCLVKSSYGLHYPLNNLILKIGTSRGVSNVADCDKAGFFSEDTLLVCIDKNKKGEEGG